MSDGTLAMSTPRVFVPFLSPARYKGAYGGRGSGKSHFFAELVIARCVGKHARIVCIREIQNSIKDSVRQLLVDKIRKLGVEHLFDITRDELRGPGGSLVVFRGMNDANAENIKSLEGFDIAWVEEAQTFSQRSLDLLRPTIRKEGSEIWFSWNPRNKSDPVDEFLRKSPPPNSAVLHVRYSDNPWFPSTLLEEMQADRIRDPEKAVHIWDGGYDVAPKGAYYGKELALLEGQGRFNDLLLDPALPIHTAWDLGIAGNMCVWLFSASMGQFKFHDFLEFSEAGLPHAAAILHKWQNESNNIWGTHLWPHDGASRDVSSGQRRQDTMAQLGFSVTILPREHIADGIEATRRLLALSYFDRVRCDKGLEHLRNYRRKFDKTRQVFVEEPDKNGHDHCADALRTAAMGQGMLTNSSAFVLPAQNYQWVA
jgi:phage terminase large subunit